MSLAKVNENILQIESGPLVLGAPINPSHDAGCRALVSLEDKQRIEALFFGMRSLDERRLASPVGGFSIRAEVARQNRASEAAIKDLVFGSCTGPNRGAYHRVYQTVKERLVSRLAGVRPETPGLRQAGRT
jgi:hypothetical protein